jgi:adenylate kinase family enzyme
LARLEERCSNPDTVKRIDDNVDVMKKRMNALNDQTIPCIEYYTKFGKVRTVHVTNVENEPKDAYAIFNDVRAEMLPQIMLLVGPTRSGKTVIGEEVCARCNIKLINFRQFLKERGLRGKDDETKVLELINSLYFEVSSRVMFEDFPQNTF